MANDEAVVIIARKECTEMFTKALEDEHGLNPREILTSGRLILFDALAILDKLFADAGACAESLDKREFDEYVDSIFGKIEKFSYYRIYGEIPSLLISRGKKSLAHQLECMWNGVTNQKNFGLLCSYSTRNIRCPPRTMTLKM